MFLLATAFAQSAPGFVFEAPAAWEPGQGSPPAPTFTEPDTTLPADASGAADRVLIDWSRGATLTALANDPDSVVGYCRAWWLDGSTRRYGAPKKWTAGLCTAVAPMAGLPAGVYTVGMDFRDHGGLLGDTPALGVRLNAAPTVTTYGPSVVEVESGEVADVTWKLGVTDDVPLPSRGRLSVTVVDANGDVAASGACVGSGSPNLACETTVRGIEPGAYTAVASARDSDGVSGVSAAATFEVNDSPGTVVLVAPSTGSTYEPDETFAVEVQVTDVWWSGTAPTASVAWEYQRTEGSAVTDSGTLGTCVMEETEPGVLSCTVDEAWSFSAVGVYTLQVTYDDGAASTSGFTTIVVNDTPALAVSGLTSGETLRLGESVATTVSVADEDAAGGTVVQHVSFGGVETTSSATTDTFGDAELTFSSSTGGTYEVWYTFEDGLGGVGTSATYEVVVNDPPALTLGVAEDSTATWEEGDGAYAFTFDVSDTDDTALSLSCSVVGFRGAAVTLDDTTTPGRRTCTVSDPGAASYGSHLVTVTAEDDHAVVTSTFWLQTVSQRDADGDGDGYTPNTGDCDDTEAAVKPGAADTCDAVDNDCDGQVNEDLADEDASGAATLGGGSVRAGRSISDSGRFAYGTDREDVWWFGWVGERDFESNAAFAVTLTVPDTGSGDPTSEWSLGADACVGSTCAGRDPAPAACVDTTACCDGVTCEIVWSVTGDLYTDHENDWYLTLIPSAWTSELCVDSAYTLTVEG